MFLCLECPSEQAGYILALPTICTARTPFRNVATVCFSPSVSERDKFSVSSGVRGCNKGVTLYQR